MKMTWQKAFNKKALLWKFMFMVCAIQAAVATAIAGDCKAKQKQTWEKLSMEIHRK